MSRIARLILISLLLPAFAPAAQIHVPEQLKDWERWVLKDKEYLACPFYFNRAAAEQGDFVCAWPGLLELEVEANSGRFSQQWTVYADDQWLPLPGDTAYWPHRVTVNGRATEVVMRGGMANVRLGPGSHRISGNFEWDERPGVLRVPAASGLVSLTVDGNDVARPERTNAGIFLGERELQSQARDAVSTQVYRLVADNVPTRLTTSLRIDVSGGVREELFGPLLPEGFVPLTINSPLPARLEPDGNLRVQVRPGSWTISLRARGADVLNSVALPTPETNLPGDEIWSYLSNDRLRVTAAEGLPPVDPQQVQVPDVWQELPAFRITAGESLTLVERSRGIVAADNELYLGRSMWLDFDGAGYIVSDEISGDMRTGWRLDMAAPFAVLSAFEDDENLLITKGSAEGLSGVELRRGEVMLKAIGRAETRRAMPVNGWDARFAGVSAVLHLPPGNKLLAAPGADKAPRSWVSQWQLLDFFLVLIITIATWRLFGRTAGIIALAALVLSFHELSAPSWLWLNLLVAIALLRVTPAGRLRQTVQVYQFTSAVVLVLALVPFVASQLRVAIYPQLEPQDRVIQAGVLASRAPAESMDYARPGVQVADQPASKAARQELMTLEESVVARGRVADSFSSYARYAPNAIVQAGPGIPSWAWNSYRLNWSGPVDAEQTMRLVILPRWAVTILRFVEVIMLLLFTSVFAAEVLKRRINLPGGVVLGRATASGFMAVGLLTLLMVTSPAVEAQTPAPELLRELENRLIEPPECAPRCAEMVAADVAIGVEAIRMTLTVHALADVAVPLPGSERGWWPRAVLLDGSAAGQVFRGRDQSLWVRLAAGRHTVVLSGPVPDVDSLEVPFPTPPRVIEADSDGWFVAGIKDRRLLSGSLQLTRLQAEGDASADVRWESSRFPAFARVERSIDLDLDWRSTTTVFRVAPSQGALTLEVPLLDGESIVTGEYTVEDGRVLVTMNPNQRSVSWRSNLPRKSPLALNAEKGAAWQEVWRVGVGSIWHANFSGVPESENPQAPYDARIAEFFPRGGESLLIEAMRPEASQGSTLAFDSVDMNAEHGNRSTSVTLELKYRSTRGAQHVIRLPDNAEVTEVLIDGDLEPLRADAGELTVPILPGEHAIKISWRAGDEISSRASTPIVDIGAAASNISLHMELPDNRWLLATNGPRLGPAVLYWSELVVLLIFALILGRTGLAPLATRHWLLLGLGFSTFSWPVLGIVIAWLLVCGAREKLQTEMPSVVFNALQLLIGAATIVALGAIVSSLPYGLLGTPDMQVTGYHSFGNSLSWFADRSESVLPTAAAWSAPMWIYKVLILAWALWLSFALLRWLPWVWQCFSSQGFWRKEARGRARRDKD
jgi:hypothetical protein